MTLGIATSRNDYLGNGATATYAYTFQIIAATDLVVTKRDTNGTQQTLSYPSAYSVTGVGVAAGGTITLTAGVLTSGYSLTIRRVRPLTQTTDLQNGAGFFAEVHEAAFDHLVMIDQAQQDDLARTLRVPESLDRALYTLELPVPVANKAIGWDPTGKLITNLDTNVVTPVSMASENVTFLAAGAGSVSRSVRAKLRDVVSVMDFGATGDGTTDDSAAFAAAYNALPATGGVIYLPPASVEYRVSGTGATTSNLIKVMNITKNNVYIVGCGKSSTVFMDNFTVAQANAQNDAGVGADVFTVFCFTSVTYGGVSDVHFRGQWDNTTPHTSGRSRAKGVGITESSHISVTRVSGSRLVGNVVNARGATAESCRYVSVTNSIAVECSENGFNYMGGTADMVFSGNRSVSNGFQGFESGTTRLVCMGNVCRANKNGVAHVGQHSLFEGNILEANTVSGFVTSYDSASFPGSYNTVRGNVCRANLAVGILGNATTAYNLIEGNYIADNNSADFSAGEGIKLASTTDRYTITGNFVGDTRATPRQRIGLNLLGATNLVVQANRVERNTVSQIVTDAGSSHFYIGNQVSAAISITTTTGVVRIANNGDNAVVQAGADNNSPFAFTATSTPATDLAAFTDGNYYWGYVQSGAAGYPRTAGSIFGYKNSANTYGYSWQVFVGPDGGALSFRQSTSGGAWESWRTLSGMGTNTAAANNLTIPLDGDTVRITGATQINALTKNRGSGQRITLVFDANPTVKHNTAGGAGTAKVMLAGAADFAASANDTLSLFYDGGADLWYETGRAVI